MPAPGLAKALIHHPDLLLLDEPANALDPAGIVEVRKLLLGLAQNDGVTVFISSHILSEVAKLATRIGVVHQGRLVKELTAAELTEAEQQRLMVDVMDIIAAQAVLAKSGIAARLEGKNSLVTTDKSAMQHPRKNRHTIGGGRLSAQPVGHRTERPWILFPGTGPG